METPSAPPAGTTTTEPTETVNPQDAVTQSPEEVEFNALKGGTQDRVKTILQERDQWKAEAERRDAFIRTNQGFTQPPVKTDSSDPQTKIALEQVDRAGVATKDWAEQKINQGLGQVIYNMELKNLESRLDGSNGTPKFDRTEYQDFVNRNPKYQNYDPEDVYNIIYSEELMDAKLKARGIVTQPGNATLKPTSTTVREEQWTPESVEARLKQADGPDWYLINKGLINKVYKEQQPKQPQ